MLDGWICVLADHFLEVATIMVVSVLDMVEAQVVSMWRTRTHTTLFFVIATFFFERNFFAFYFVVECSDVMTFYKTFDSHLFTCCPCTSHESPRQHTFVHDAVHVCASTFLPSLPSFLPFFLHENRSKLLEISMIFIYISPSFHENR